MSTARTASSHRHDVGHAAWDAPGRWFVTVSLVAIVAFVAQVSMAMTLPALRGLYGERGLIVVNATLIALLVAPLGCGLVVMRHMRTRGSSRTSPRQAMRSSARVLESPRAQGLAAALALMTVISWGVASSSIVSRETAAEAFHDMVAAAGGDLASTPPGTLERYGHRLRRIDQVAGLATLLGLLASTGVGMCVAGLQSNRRASMQARQASDFMLRCFVEHAPAAVAMVDRSMRYIAWSERWMRDYGLANQGDLTGKRLDEAPASMPTHWREAHRRCLEGHVETCRRDSIDLGGGTCWLEWEFRPWRRPSGEVGGIVLFTRDVTEQVVAETIERAKLAVAETRLQVAKALASSGGLSARFESVLSAMMGLKGLGEPVGASMLLIDPITGRPQSGASCGTLGPDFAESREASAILRRLRDANDPEGRVVTLREASGVRYVVPLVDRSREEPECTGAIVLLTTGEADGEGSVLDAMSDIGDLVATALLHERAAVLAEQARIEAEEASRAKSDFLANMSHEIRTPMAAILGYTDLLAEDGDRGSAPKHRLEYIDTIQRNGEHLLTIINDILDLSKIEAGKMTVERIETRPREILADVVCLMRVKATGKGITLCVDHDTPVPETIQSDPVRLRQILVNLVGNAIKFTELGGVTIRVGLDRLASGGTQLRLAIVDTGIGMDEEQLGRLFSAFSQADASTTRRFGGTGLGLRISQTLARMLGGDIVVSSTPGRGSTFTVTVDTGSLEGVAMLAPDTGEPVTEIREPAKLGDAQPLKGLRVFLAEDGPDNQRLISFHLVKCGANVRVFENGRLALEALTNDGTIDGPLLDDPPCDIVLTDMQMPEMDGYTLASTLRAKGWTRRIVALTAHAMSGDARRCVEAGCDTYASKPIDRAGLIEVCRTPGSIVAKAT
ncbi:MAG: ATP-binding protein [Phycisphaerae bacterium]